MLFPFAICPYFGGKTSWVQSNSNCVPFCSQLLTREATRTPRGVHFAPFLNMISSIHCQSLCAILKSNLPKTIVLARYRRLLQSFDHKSCLYLSKFLFLTGKWKNITPPEKMKRPERNKCSTQKRDTEQWNPHFSFMVVVAKGEESCLENIQHPVNNAKLALGIDRRLHLLKMQMCWKGFFLPLKWWGHRLLRNYHHLQLPLPFSL